METKRIVITGGPGTGKSSLIHKLHALGNMCLPEISRELILQARKDGIDQLFLKNSLLFSKLLLNGRLKQFEEATRLESKILFYDRGLHDVIAYLEFAKEDCPVEFKNICRNHTYDMVFILPPWKDIYVKDNERYEDFKEAILIHNSLERVYKMHDYNLIEVPKTTMEERAEFILKRTAEFR